MLVPAIIFEEKHKSTAPHRYLHIAVFQVMLLRQPLESFDRPVPGFEHIDIRR
jgi:hypothetical protein